MDQAISDMPRTNHRLLIFKVHVHYLYSLLHVFKPMHPLDPPLMGIESIEIRPKFLGTIDRNATHVRALYCIEKFLHLRPCFLGIATFR